MRVALGLARRGLGRTGPNPTVGCVILDPEGRVAGQARTADGGRPHAETQALAQAGERARGGTAIVTLEPCAHQGETGPCADALISAGIAHAVIATTDPDPRTAGAGIERLRAAGISTEVGVLEAEARALNAGFIKRVTKGLPHLTLKLGLSLDGKIALANGTSQWITGPEARQRGHMLRAQADFLLTGAKTVLKDEPRFTVRIAGVYRAPTRPWAWSTTANAPIRRLSAGFKSTALIGGCCRAGTSNPTCARWPPRAATGFWPRLAAGLPAPCWPKIWSMKSWCSALAKCSAGTPATGLACSALPNWRRPRSSDGLTCWRWDQM